jgi:hypothetical protein
MRGRITVACGDAGMRGRTTVACGGLIGEETKREERRVGGWVRFTYGPHR